MGNGQAGWWQPTACELGYRQHRGSRTERMLELGALKSPRSCSKELQRACKQGQAQPPAPFCLHLGHLPAWFGMPHPSRTGQPWDWLRIAPERPWTQSLIARGMGCSTGRLPPPSPVSVPAQQPLAGLPKTTRFSKSCPAPSSDSL